ncbi:TRAP transporter small permease subunit [Paracoccus aerius]|jgi:TRAP-type mannitol/chloroaromatic compound transport system permease small subunit|uniref:TRAP transporter small permease protein n=1 Tax=Paracoccus aerius TaxID=1915382 RepID=A0ABS1S168_9RHOB|nr:TRAP transporter small permease subunit [Paracoccus aerius]MBL3672452.1 TRAP transporter small permease subunit [Paracoccus aerius]GHG10102.1 C4-dicarboxylate ABC transporter [Paracoccus aerius]
MNGLLALSRGIDRVNTVIGRNVSWLILLAIFVSAINAVIRKAFSMSSNAWLELQWYLYGAAFLLAAAYTLLENEHIRIDILFGALSRRVQHWIELLGHIFFLMPMVLLTLWLTWPWLARSYRTGEMSMNAGGLMLWPAKALLFTGFLLLLLQGISEIIKKIAVMRGLIPDYNAPSGHHAPLDLDEDLLKQAGFADPDHPLTDIPVDKTREDARK